MMKAMKISVLLAVLGTATGCGHQLRHAGYVQDKVWYHWQDGQKGPHSLVVCDVQPNGSETNCKESPIDGK